MKKQRVFISPLNWGLGHATRCIPIIKTFLEWEWEVIIGAEDEGYALLKEEFPELNIITFPGIHINYSRNIPLALKILFQSPKILMLIYSEHVRLQKIIEEYRIDLVISDNRYGLWTNKVPAIFMTHQQHIQLPSSLTVFSPFITSLNRFFTGRFHRLWVPDYRTPPTIAGKLSHPPLLDNTDYIGPLSRLSISLEGLRYDFFIVVSGPEPQRSIFEEKVMQELGDIKQKGVMVRGLPGRDEPPYFIGNTIVYNHLPGKAMQKSMATSGLIICRSGYSTIMDLIALNKPAVFIPTPGQTEQEYLSKHLQGASFDRMLQKDFSLEKALRLGQLLQKPDEFPTSHPPQSIADSLHKLNDQFHE